MRTVRRTLAQLGGPLATVASQLSVAGSSLILALVVSRHYGLSQLGSMSPALAVTQLVVGIWRVGYLEVGLVSDERVTVLSSARYRRHGQLLTVAIVAVVAVSAAFSSSARSLVLPSVILSLSVGYETFRYRKFIEGRAQLAAVFDSMILLALVCALLFQRPEPWLVGVLAIKVLPIVPGFIHRTAVADLGPRGLLVSRRQTEGYLWGFGPTAILASAVLLYAGPNAAGSVRVVLLLLGPIGVLYATVAVLVLPRMSDASGERAPSLFGLTFVVGGLTLLYVGSIALVPTDVTSRVTGPEAAAMIESHLAFIGAIVLLKAAEIPGTLVARSEPSVGSFIIGRRLHGVVSLAATMVLIPLSASSLESFLSGYLVLLALGAVGWTLLGFHLRSQGRVPGSSSRRGPSAHDAIVPAR